MSKKFCPTCPPDSDCASCPDYAEYSKLFRRDLPNESTPERKEYILKNYTGAGYGNIDK